MTKTIETKNFQKRNFNLPLQAPVTVAPIALSAKGVKFFEKEFRGSTRLCWDICESFLGLLREEKPSETDSVDRLLTQLNELCKNNNYNVAYNAFSKKVFNLYQKDLPKKCFSSKLKKSNESMLVKQWYLHHPETRELFNYWLDTRSKYRTFKEFLKNYCKGRNIYLQGLGNTL